MARKPQLYHRDTNDIVWWESGRQEIVEKATDMEKLTFFRSNPPFYQGSTVDPDGKRNSRYYHAGCYDGPREAILVGRIIELRNHSIGRR